MEDNYMLPYQPTEEVQENANWPNDLMSSAGTYLNQIPITNPYTGKVHTFTIVEMMQYDAHGNPLIIRRVNPIMADCGHPIYDPRQISFCAITKGTFCILHTVICPYCGNIVSLIASRLVEFNGVVLRVCLNCLPMAQSIPLFSSLQTPPF